MRVTEKVQKTNAVNTAKAHKTQIKALDKCISYNDKLRLMVLEVLREESGRELASVARFNGGQFDWETHNAQFRADYSETPLKELMRAGRILYGLTDMDAIRDRRAKHRGIRNQRLARQSSGVASSSQSVYEEVDVDDDIDDLDWVVWATKNIKNCLLRAASLLLILGVGKLISTHPPLNWELFYFVRAIFDLDVNFRGLKKEEKRGENSTVITHYTS